MYKHIQTYVLTGLFIDRLSPSMLGNNLLIKERSVTVYVTRKSRDKGFYKYKKNWLASDIDII